MSRSSQASVPSDRADDLVEELDRLDGIVGISLQRGASLKPPGDVLVVQTTNEAAKPVQAWLADVIGESGFILTSEPQSLASPSGQRQIDEETNEASWPEMAALLRSETNVSSNYLLAMVLSGAVAGWQEWQQGQLCSPWFFRRRGLPGGREDRAGRALPE